MYYLKLFGRHNYWLFFFSFFFALIYGFKKNKAKIRWRSSIQSTKTRPRADCGSDHQLFIAKFKAQIEESRETTRPFSYDLNQIPYDYTAVVTSRLKGLDLTDRVPEGLRTEVCNIVRFQGKPFNTTVIQVYAPTSNAEEAEVEWFYEDLQDLLELTPQKHVLFIIGDCNTKVGSQETPGLTGKFGLGIWH